MLVSDNGPQYGSSSFAESMVKVVKQLLQCAKYSGSDPQLALLSYRSTPLDSKIASPAELLYRGQLQSTLPAQLRNTAPDADDTQEALNNRAVNSKAHHDRTAGQKKAPFYAGQDVSVWDTQRRLWLPAKIIRRTADCAYLIETSAGSQYIWTHDHLKAHHVAAHQTAEETEELKPSVPATVPHATAPTVASATSATPDKPSVLLLKPLPTAPATPAKQPATPRLAKPSPAAPAPTPVLRRSQ